MPCLKSPGSLLDVSLLYVYCHIIRAAAVIQARYGSYDNEECRTHIAKFQQYLLTYIPSVVLEEVFNKYHQQKCHNSDNRIWFAIFMHRSMRIFQVQVNIRENKADDSFWIKNVAYLNNLVELDLHLVCTDEILEVVGRCCRKLTKINITSKVETDAPSTSLAGPFNAMKLNFFVSDKGLRHLSNCKDLRAVTMSPLIRSRGGGRTMSVAGIRQLVKSLPFVQFVSYGDMGVVISDDMDDVDSLRLVRINDIHPDASHIEAMSRLCPKLRALLLTSAFNKTNTVKVMDALRESNLTVESLDLINFPASESLTNLIKVKGAFLTRLYLKTCTITFDIVSNIGLCCMNLNRLVLTEDFRRRIDTPEAQIPARGCSGFRSMYVGLEFLNVLSVQWNPLILLPMLITNAKKLQSLSILSHKDYGSLDETFIQILQANPLQELMYISVDCILGPNGIRAICHCPNLRYFKYVVNCHLPLNCIAEIKQEFSDRNFDFTFEEVMAGKRDSSEFDLI